MDHIKIADVVVGEGRRPLDESHIDRLKVSMSALGLLCPITVTPDHRLIAGHHRLKAAEALGWDGIDCIVKDYDSIDAELAEIDENLLQKQALPGETAKMMARSKELYLARHPEARPGGDRKSSGSKGEPRPLIPRFSEARASQTGKSRRSVDEFVQIGQAFSEEDLQVLDAAGVGKCDMMELSRKDHETRKEAVQAAASEGKEAVKQFIPGLSGHKRPAPHAGEAVVPGNGSPTAAHREAGQMIEVDRLIPRINRLTFRSALLRLKTHIELRLEEADLDVTE